MRFIPIVFILVTGSVFGQDGMENFNNARAKQKVGDNKGAIVEYTKHIEKNLGSKHLYSTYANRAAAYTELKQYDKAIEDYNKSIEAYSGDGIGYSGRAYVYFILKEYNKAIADCNTAISKWAKNASAYNIRANAYNETKQPEKACKDWMKVKELGSTAADESIKQHCK